MSELDTTEDSAAASAAPESISLGTPKPRHDEAPAAAMAGQESDSAEENESFGEIFSQFEKAHSRNPEDGNRQIEATVIALSAEAVFFDIGYKTEGILPLTALGGKEVKVGDKYQVSIKNRDAEGYYELSLLKSRNRKTGACWSRPLPERKQCWGRSRVSSKAG